ncbi:MAG: type III-B CRISPR module RAMP protein Cmr6 [Okeania sp. SIO3B3]|nr:type III-B CRISPR module RAMP protein Cmr6 [Okeania sp. SIO3B3]
MSNKPSPWLKHPLLPPYSSDNSSFVEYLRWMRIQLPDGESEKGTINSGTILELFEKFENNDWSENLNRLTKRTIKLADESFKVFCPWRIRVGGTKGPESILLPAFDALGMPYIPSSTLRGIAREMATQDKNFTEEKVKEFFGHIDNGKTQMGQVTFLDAYPLPDKYNQGGLSPDMANQIWKWEDNKPPEYNTNPNICISLEKPIFVIGLRRTAGCSDETLKLVRNWLIKGLSQGIGSRVNTGYGTLLVQSKNEELRKQVIRKPIIIKVEFELEGQLIHGRQDFAGWRQKRNNNGWKPPGDALPEVRPTAFRSILRYWFRALALGVLKPQRVQELEAEIFGGIEPQAKTGLFRLEASGKIKSEPTDNDPGSMSGQLTLRRNSLSMGLNETNKGKYEALGSLLKTLTWLMFHLGGVGQGARRPCYERTSSNPLWRGANLFPDLKGKDKFWYLPNKISEFQKLFRQHLRNFYQSLGVFSTEQINTNSLLSVRTNNKWSEAVDGNCKIVVCSGESSGNKGFALSVLHSSDLKRTGKKGLDYDPEICGGVQPNAIPSPVWIRELNYGGGIDFHVVTVFGAETGKRKEFLDKLKNKAGNNYLTIFPLPRN